MFGYLYNALSFLLSRWWPVADGQITAVDIERTGDRDQYVRLSVAYKFSIGDDGPYTGENSWIPMMAWNQVSAMRKVRRRLHLRQRVKVRYRRNDPSVNTLDGGVGKLLRPEGF
ncbi:MAG TPA: DUF3592 domain-containing protein [Verrucomicrobiae bacterium]|jgi:hypothetical protein|nr:DUF3592 domain-containing protein [Verrucomicrobiae bacterium]